MHPAKRLIDPNLATRANRLATATEACVDCSVNSVRELICLLPAQVYTVQQRLLAIVDVSVGDVKFARHVIHKFGSRGFETQWQHKQKLDARAL